MAPKRSPPKKPAPVVTTFLAVALALAAAQDARPPLPPCDLGVPTWDLPGGDTVRGLAPRPVSECAAFRDRARDAPAEAAVQLLESAADWTDYAAAEIPWVTTLQRQMEVVRAVMVAERAAWGATFYLGAAGPCAESWFRPNYMEEATGVGSDIETSMSPAIREIVFNAMRSASGRLRELARNVHLSCGVRE